MCGISGIVSKNGHLKLIPSIIRTNDLLAHRGPDDEGYVCWNDQQHTTYFGKATPSAITEYHTPYAPVRSIHEAMDQPVHLTLGHRRLSILDLSLNGHQPMCTDDGLWIVFNGEIYNYVELRTLLTQKGYQFRTQTDTEVLLHAYKEWGIKLLDHLNGMWAFVIWDKEKNQLFGSRDRFGVKPLYYVSNSEIFAFASEIKALTHLSETSVNREAAWDYLIAGKSETSRESLFQTIYELKPSEYFIYDLTSNTCAIKNYYQLNYTTDWNNPTIEGHATQIEEIHHLLENAIRIRLRSDVPIGASLSGGLDSSTIVSYILKAVHTGKQHIQSDTLHLFTAHFPDEPTDEYHWAAKIAQQPNTHWHTTQPKAEQLLTNMDQLIYAQDIPFFSMSVYSHFQLMQRVQEQHIKINFDGQGSDELFAGYQRHYNCFMWDALSHKDAHAIYSNAAPPYYSSFNSPKTMLKQLAKSAIRSMPFQNLFFTHKEHSYFQPDFLKEFKEKDADYHRYYGLQPLNQLLQKEFCGPDLKVLLRTGDRNAMHFGIETRVPFADDHLLIEKIFSLPASMKINNGFSKSLLREATKGIVPENVRLRRDKIGYATPEVEWLKAMQKNIYDHMPTHDDEFIQYSKLKKNWFTLMNSETDPYRMWRMINFMRWQGIYNL